MRGRSWDQLWRIVLLPAVLLAPAATSFVMSASAAQGDSGTGAACSAVQKVLVIGANGQTGSRVVRLLRESDSFEPLAMIRDEAQSSKFDAMGVKWVLGSVEEGSLEQHMHGVDAVIFAAGAGRQRGPLKQVLVDYSGAIRSVVAAQESESVRRFLLLSGINSDVQGTRRSDSASYSDFSGPLSSWHKLKAHSENYLRESHLYGRQLNWTILCPGTLCVYMREKEGEGRGGDGGGRDVVYPRWRRADACLCVFAEEVPARVCLARARANTHARTHTHTHTQSHTHTHNHRQTGGPT